MPRVAWLTVAILALFAAPAGAATVVADHLARPRGLALAPTRFASGLTTISALATGLHHPGGIAVGKDGAVYVSDWSVAGATRKDAYRRHTGRILRVQ